MESELEVLASKDQTLEPGGEDSAKEQRAMLKTDSDLSSATVTVENILELERNFEPFVRRDAYGTMGRGETSIEEKFLIGFALLTFVPFRLVFGVMILVFSYLVCRLCTVPDGEDGEEDHSHMVGWRRVVLVQSGKFLSRVMLFNLGFYWISESYGNPFTVKKSATENEWKEQSDESERPGAIISNHISYLDVLYHMSSSFPSFVAKRSVVKLPLVGLISKCLGCVYVHRESISSESKGVSGIVAERVQEAHQNKLAPMMMLFPEGTTTNGDFLLPFKTGVFLSKAPVLPVILRYPYQRFSPAWESISGVRHMILLLCQFVNHIEVTRLPVYYPSEQEKEDPKLYANNVRKLMALENGEGCPIMSVLLASCLVRGNLKLSDTGLVEKRAYHAALQGFFGQK